MSGFKERLDAEFAELSERVQKLSEFLETRAALTVHSNEQLNLLVIQLHCMKAYQSVLERRIQILKEDKQ